MILNQTPVRTSKNYGINDIELDLEIPKITEFDNITILSDELENIDISDDGILTSKIGLELRVNKNINISIPENKKIKEPIIIEFNFDEDNRVLVDNIKVVFEKNSKANIILKYISDDDEKHFHYLKQEIIANESSKGNIIIANLMNNNSQSFIAVENELNENSEIEHILLELGANEKISNYYSKLVGDNSNNVVKNIYIGTEQNIIDINYNIDELGQNTKCDISSEGAISGNTRKNFKGTIDFKKGCKKSIGLENENCMILSPTAKSKSLPMLLCHEEDVEGAHGVSSGKLDEYKIFYIMTKGISYEDARKLIVKANFNEIISLIESEDLKNEINNRVDKLLTNK